MKGFKGFKKGLVCRDKQYRENTVFEEDDAVICKSGMHFCENPFDVLDYYGLVNDKGEFNDFAEVEALDETYTDDNKKYCTKKLKVGAKLSFSGFVGACIEFLIDRTSIEKMELEEVDEGDSAQLASSGDYAQLASSGDYAKLASSGDYAQLASSGDYAQLASLGNSAKLASSGDYAQLASSGNSAKIESEGEDSVICCAGIDSIAKAKKGSWITLSEWAWSEEKSRNIPVCVKTEYVDGDNIKENTFYMLENGQFKVVD